MRHVAGDGDTSAPRPERSPRRARARRHRRQSASLTPWRASFAGHHQAQPARAPVISAVRPRRGISLPADHLAGGEQGAGRRRHPEELPAGVPIHHSPPRRLRPRAAAPGSWVSSRFPSPAIRLMRILLTTANPAPGATIPLRAQCAGRCLRPVIGIPASRSRIPDQAPAHSDRPRMRIACRRMQAPRRMPGSGTGTCVDSMSARAGPGSVLLEGNGRAFTGRRCIR